MVARGILRKLSKVPLITCIVFMSVLMTVLGLNVLALSWNFLRRNHPRLLKLVRHRLDIADWRLWFPLDVRGVLRATAPNMLRTCRERVKTVSSLAIANINSRSSNTVCPPPEHSVATNCTVQRPR